MRSDRVYGYGSRRGGIGARDDGCAVGVGLRAGPERFEGVAIFSRIS